MLKLVTGFLRGRATIAHVRPHRLSKIIQGSLMLAALKRAASAIPSTIHSLQISPTHGVIQQAESW